MNERIRAAMAQQLLSVEAAAERLDTKPRFIRRLIAERRIEFVRIGRHVRAGGPPDGWEAPVRPGP